MLLMVAGCGGRAHRHGSPVVVHPGKLAVEVTAGGRQEDALRSGASAGLARTPFAVEVDGRGEVELEMDVSQLGEQGDATVCRVKILVLRLPGDSLLGIADGGARVRGTGGDAADACVEGLGATLIKSKVRGLLRRELRARR